MKRVYLKPDIIFESFSLSESLATNCEVIVDGPSSGKCGYAYEGGNGATVFIDSTTGCTVPTPDQVENGFCYHVPIESNSLFNS